MAYVNGGPMINFDPNLCEYCHQRPKFQPYDYCGRTCGTLAKAAGNQAARPAAICKQCNQRPVYQNHQFCGRGCAGAWTAAHGQINTGSSGAPWPSTWNQNMQQTVQGGGQFGQRQGGIKGIVNGLRNFISPTQQQSMMGPVQAQQPYVNTNATSPTWNAGALTTASPTTTVSSAPSNQFPRGTSPHSYSLPPPNSGGISNQNDNNQLSPYNGAYPISPAPLIRSSSSGSSVPQISNTTNLDQSQVMPSAAWNGTSLPSYSAGYLDYASQPDDSDADAVPGSFLDQEHSENENENENEGDEMDEVLVDDVDVQSIESFVYPPSVSSSGSIGTCKLKGCSNPTFVDSITDLESEYCSQKHQGDAVVSKQAVSCIMCHKMPRGPNNHFCSVECRTKALSP